MPKRNRTAERRRAARRAMELERLARYESDPVRAREMQTEAAWAEFEIGRAAGRFGHCPCGLGRCCSCGSYDVDGPYCGEPLAPCTD